MTDVDCSGVLVGSRGRIVPLLNTAQTEGSAEAVNTDSNFVGSAIAAGTYASQLGGTYALARAGITAENNISTSWIRSAGRIKAGLPVGSTGSGGDDLPAPLPYPVRLVPGDEVVTSAQAAATRTVGLTVACSNGEYHCFDCNGW